MTLHVSISQNLAVPSSHPLTTFFPFRDNAILYTLPSPSLQSSPNCFLLFEFHTRSEPPNEQVMIFCPPGRSVSEVIQVRCYLSFHRSNFKIITYEEVSIAMSRQQGKVIFLIKSELNAQLPDALFGLLKLDAAAVENMDMNQKSVSTEKQHSCQTYSSQPPPPHVPLQPNISLLTSATAPQIHAMSHASMLSDASSVSTSALTLVVIQREGKEEGTLSLLNALMISALSRSVLIVR
ncbi:hypothetical protein EV424DRAFT_1535898 [Suillus variegatus]|nr:hypothetical protein EV424DRAFT_1535898 [Suillus variegatus]